MKISKPTKDEISISLTIVGCFLVLVYITLPVKNNFGLTFAIFTIPYPSRTMVIENRR
ncbi:hypothetical protein [Maribacter sp. R77961]|uniref:hypothetical protein n=1 Tax=Maribacter sp. R77961 TaxID=3093871 RepID=UPI0037CBF88A